MSQSNLLWGRILYHLLLFSCCISCCIVFQYRIIPLTYKNYSNMLESVKPLYLLGKTKKPVTITITGFTGDERIELPPKVLETPIIPFDQSPIQLSLNSSDLLSIPYGVMNVKKKIKKIQEMFQGWFSNSESNYNAFIKAMLRGNVKEMNTYINEVALATFSSFDTGRHPSGKSQPERFYHGFVLGLLVELRDRYEVKSNRESGYGRYDVMLIPRETPDQAIIKKEEATSKSLLPFFVLLQNSKIHHCFFQNFFMCIFHLCQRCSKSSNFFSHHVKSSLNRDRVHFTEESINQWKCI